MEQILHNLGDNFRKLKKERDHWLAQGKPIEEGGKDIKIRASSPQEALIRLQREYD